MTREEALEIFQNRLRFARRDYSDAVLDYIQALEMAIEALKQPEIIYCKDCKYCNNNTEYCQKHNKWYCMYDNTTKSQKHYCSCAERKDDE